MVAAGAQPALGLSMDAVSWRRGPDLILNIDGFSLPPDGQALVIGPSGCGKTTLLSLLAGLLPIQQGRVVVAGQDLAALGRQGAKAVDRFRARTIGLVPQQAWLLGMLDVMDNLLLAQQLAGVSIDRPAARALLAQLGLAGLERRRPGALSRGQQQRVALARALINRPRLILADEPTANLDDEHAAQSIELLCARARDLGACLLVATHDHRIRSRFGHVLVLPARALASLA